MLRQALLSAMLFSSLTALANAHFVMEIPTSLGYNDSAEATAPCDTFNPTDRSTGVTSWPIGGSAISVITTHPSVTWDIQAALVNDTTTWVRLVPVLNQTTGVGFFCEPQIPGIARWIGLPAVLQMVQHAPDGVLYQCAAIQFAAGAAAPTPSGCFNSSGFTVHWD